MSSLQTEFINVFYAILGGTLIFSIPFLIFYLDRTRTQRENSSHHILIEYGRMILTFGSWLAGLVILVISICVLAGILAPSGDLSFSLAIAGLSLSILFALSQIFDTIYTNVDHYSINDRLANVEKCLRNIDNRIK